MNITSIATDVDCAHWQTNLAIVAGALAVISEVLPFIKSELVKGNGICDVLYCIYKSKCWERSETLPTTVPPI